MLDIKLFLAFRKFCAFAVLTWQKNEKRNLTWRRALSVSPLLNETELPNMKHLCNMLWNGNLFVVVGWAAEGLGDQSVSADLYFVKLVRRVKSVYHCRMPNH